MGEVVDSNGFLLKPTDEQYIDPSAFHVLCLHQERAKRLGENDTSRHAMPDEVVQILKDMKKVPQPMLTSQALSLLMLFPTEMNFERQQFEWLL